MDPVVLKTSVFVFWVNIMFTECSPMKYQIRSTLPEWTDYSSFQPEGPGTYSFGYDIEDPEKDNIQFRDEERHPNGTVRGSYGHLRPDGIVHIVHYTADKSGYRATIENYPRGQLKLKTNNPNTIMMEGKTKSSTGLASDLQSKGVYKNPGVYEQHLRPVDSKLRSTLTSTGIKLENINGIYRTRSSSDDLGSVSSQNKHPYRLFDKIN